MTRKREPFVYAAGDMVRLEGRPGRVHRIRLNGLVDVWTDYGLRTVLGAALSPPKPGDTLTPLPNEWRARRKAGAR